MGLFTPKGEDFSIGKEKKKMKNVDSKEKFQKSYDYNEKQTLFDPGQATKFENDEYSKIQFADEISIIAKNEDSERNLNSFDEQDLSRANQMLEPERKEVYMDKAVNDIIENAGFDEQEKKQCACDKRELEKLSFYFDNRINGFKEEMLQLTEYERKIQEKKLSAISNIESDLYSTYDLNQKLLYHSQQTINQLQKQLQETYNSSINYIENMKDVLILTENRCFRPLMNACIDLQSQIEIMEGLNESKEDIEEVKISKHLKLIKGEILLFLSQNGIEEVVPNRGDKFDDINHRLSKESLGKNLHEDGWVIDYTVTAGFKLEEQFIFQPIVSICKEDEIKE